jgi:hypothetical protein
MEEAAAIKAVAMAQAGNFQMLSRYIPALRNATSETEKAALVNDFFAKGYQQQKDELNTLSGRWMELKGRIGDALEVIGGAIAGNSRLQSAIAGASEKVREFGERVADWVSSGGMSALLYNVEFVAKESAERMQWLARSAIQIFRNMAQASSNIWENTTDTIGYYLAKAHAKVTGQQWNLQPPDLRKWNEGIEKLPEFASDARAEYERKMAGIGMPAPSAGPRAAAEPSEVFDIAGSIQDAKTIEKAQADAAQSIADLNKQLLEKQKSEREKELQAELEGLEKIRAKREEIAAKTVDGFIEEQRAAKDAEKQKEADAKKADRLRKAEARGTRLSKSNREFLDAFTAIEEAGAGLEEDDPIMKQLDVAKDNLEQLKNDGKTLADILSELETANAEQKKINQDLTALLRQA